jgi:hypothetical protein
MGSGRDSRSLGLSIIKLAQTNARILGHRMITLARSVGAMPMSWTLIPDALSKLAELQHVFRTCLEHCADRFQNESGLPVIGRELRGHVTRPVPRRERGRRLSAIGARFNVPMMESMIGRLTGKCM